MADQVGIEPTTRHLQGDASAVELLTPNSSPARMAPEVLISRRTRDCVGTPPVVCVPNGLETLCMAL